MYFNWYSHNFENCHRKLPFELSDLTVESSSCSWYHSPVFVAYFRYFTFHLIWRVIAFGSTYMLWECNGIMLAWVAATLASFLELFGGVVVSISSVVHWPWATWLLSKSDLNLPKFVVVSLFRGVAVYNKNVSICWLWRNHSIAPWWCKQVSAEFNGYWQISHCNLRW